MKKLMIACAAALVGLSAAQAADITSANIVGYTTINVQPSTYYLVGTQFTEVKDGATSVSFDKLIKMDGIEAVSWKNRRTGPQILVREGELYTTYYYTTEAYVEADDEEVTGWANGDGDLIDFDMNVGAGFWILTPANTAAGATITFAGQVVSNFSLPAEFGVNYTIVCNPLPIPVDLSKVEMSGITAVTWKNRRTGPQILVREGELYTTYYYTTEAYVEADDEEVTGWANGDGDLATGVLIQPGEGFWVNTPDAGTITFGNK